MARAGTVALRTVAGQTFHCSNRVYWHLLWTIFVLRVRFPKARLQILQTCYHSGVDLSKGTCGSSAASSAPTRGELSDSSGLTAGAPGSGMPDLGRPARRGTFT